MAVSVNISKVLMDLTGEPRTEIAIFEILKDAVEHRIEKIETELKRFEERYNMTFEEFKKKFSKDEIPESYSYDVEIDFLEWEGFISRISKYKSLLAALS
jgi:predicted DNA-binding protein YlxM (UPF0122 family)